MRRIIILLAVLFVILYLLIYNSINIDYIEQNTGNIQFIKEKSLILNDNYGSVKIPHLNIKGIVKEINNDYVIIALSDKSQEFLNQKDIKIKNGVNLQINEKVFVIFENINIESDKLIFSTLKIYELVDNIKAECIRESSVICFDSYGGLMKIKGKTFKYENNEYFLSNINLAEDDEVYYKNIEDGTLLYEPYKHIIYQKFFNMINPQETNFNIIINLYK